MILIGDNHPESLEHAPDANENRYRETLTPSNGTRLARIDLTASGL
jgi:hypothetical protein